VNHLERAHETIIVWECHPKKLAAFCYKWKITEMSTVWFGLREDFRPDSDVDVFSELRARGKMDFARLFPE